MKSPKLAQARASSCQGSSVDQRTSSTTSTCRKRSSSTSTHLLALQLLQRFTVMSKSDKAGRVVFIGNIPYGAQSRSACFGSSLTACRHNRGTNRRDPRSRRPSPQFPPGIRQGDGSTQGFRFRRVRRRRRSSLRRAQFERPRTDGQKTEGRLVERQWLWRQRTFEP